ncbi:MAG TPA: cupredoxin domain-containing protein [candidate division Zixibacteria bacterium]|nr:cupredoxin domain-containing protein [candidate division Zixibacteria bacterium]
MNRYVRAAALLALAALLVACVPRANLPESCADPAVTLAVTLVDERLEPTTLEVCRGQRVTIELDVRRDAVFHVHGYDAELPARQVSAGETVELQFTAVRSGQFPIAIHTEDGPGEAEVGALIVHER